MIRALILAAVCAAVALAAGAQHSVSGWDPKDIENAEATVNAIKEEDPGMAKFFDNAAGYAVFPTVGKGAIGIGGAHGKGVVFAGGRPIGKTSVTQVTIGFQWGGQAYSEIVFFENDKTLNSFTAGNFEFAAQASAVAATAGVSADLAYDNGVAVVTMAKGGLMYEASIGGQKFSFTPLGDNGDKKEDKKEE
jgi:lipid-binding SYLF domain-containing protein